MPQQHLMDKIKDQKIKDFISEVNKKTKRVTIKDVIPNIEADALDLLEKLLQYDPSKRLSAEDALRHPYFAEIYRPEEEPISKPIQYFDFEFEQYTLDKKILRELILDEIILYHSQSARNYYEQCKAKFPNGVLEKIYNRNDADMSDDCDSQYDNETQSSSTNSTPEKNTFMEE